MPPPGAAAYGVGSETVRHLTRLVERVAGTTTPARVMADAPSMRRKTPYRWREATCQHPVEPLAGQAPSASTTSGGGI